MDNAQITSVLKEERFFEPPEPFRKQALIGSDEEYRKLWNEAKDQPESFWGRQAKEHLDWFTPFEKVLEWEAPHAKWFLGGKINASYNCVDRHMKTWRKNKAAIVWEGEPGDTRVLTFSELHREVCKFANGLKSLGIKPGDRVTIYMPMVPELAIAVLGCARVGAVHSVIFGGFSSEAIADRNNDAEAKLVITADGGWRRGHVVPLKKNVDLAMAKSPTVENVVVCRRTESEVQMQAGRDVWWHDLVAEQSSDCPAEVLDSEHPLFILYTSGSTGKPKGILHSTGGYLMGAALSSRYIFDLKD